MQPAQVISRWDVLVTLDLDSVWSLMPKTARCQGQPRSREERVSRRGQVRVTCLPDLIIIIIINIIIIIIINLTDSRLRARLVVLVTSNRNLTMVTASRLVVLNVSASREDSSSRRKFHRSKFG